jgi:mannosyl-oligosaccharide glucosidase
MRRPPHAPHSAPTHPLPSQGLRHYSATAGPHQAAAASLHEELRSSLVRNLVEQYNSSGYLWEQYDDTTGAGKGSHPFTGWTALLALLAAEGGGGGG